jgi:hypothetical protein
MEPELCKSKKNSCNDLSEWKTWCETAGAISNGERCIWIEGNEELNIESECIEEVLLHINIFFILYCRYYR